MSNTRSSVSREPKPRRRSRISVRHIDFAVVGSGQLPAQAHAAILTGFHIANVRDVAADLGLGAEDVAERIGISRTTYHRRLSTGDKLDSLQSDALAKYGSLFKSALEAFDGDPLASREWLKTPQVGLDNQIPIEFARTTVGFREVEKLLTRINYGVYA